MTNSKPLHVKPSLYAHYFEILKPIAYEYGYNLVLHGSLNRDLDLIAIPWQEVLKPHEQMVAEMADAIGGYIMLQNGGINQATHHGRLWYVVNINRGEYVPPFAREKPYEGDKQYYLDISVIPASK